MHLITARKGRKAVCVMSEHTIFRKWKKTAAGKLFATYLTTLKMKDGGSRTVAVEVLVVAETVKKDDAAAMYKEV